MLAIDHKFNIWRDQKTDDHGQSKFYQAFSKSRGIGLLKHLMKKKRLYIQIRFDWHGLAKIRFNNYASRKAENISKKYSKLPAPPTSFCHYIVHMKE